MYLSSTFFLIDESFKNNQVIFCMPRFIIIVLSLLRNIIRMVFYRNQFKKHIFIPFYLLFHTKTFSLSKGKKYIF